MMDSIKRQTADNADFNSQPSPTKHPYDDNDHCQEFVIDLKQSSEKRFGFSIIGGNEYSTSIQVGRIEIGGSADCDGRLKLYDVILQVNNVSFTKISHQAARKALKSAGKHINMRIQRAVPRIKNEMQLYPSENDSRFSLVRSMTSAFDDTNTDISTANITLHPSNNPSKQFRHNIPNSQRSNFGNEDSTNTKPLSQNQTETGNHLKQLYLEENDRGADDHPKSIYTPHPNFRDYPPPILPRNRINSLPLDYNSEKTVRPHSDRNANSKPIFNSHSFEINSLLSQRSLSICEKPTPRISRQNANNIHCDGKKPIAQTSPMIPYFKGNIKDIMKYGNCVKDLRVSIRKLLEEDSPVELSSWENPDYSGKYVLHRDIDPLTGRPRRLVVHIKLDRSEKREEEMDNYRKTITTYHFKTTLSYE